MTSDLHGLLNLSWQASELDLCLYCHTFYLLFDCSHIGNI